MPAAPSPFEITLTGMVWRTADSWDAAAQIMDRAHKFGFCKAPDGEIRVRWQGEWLTRADLRVVEPRREPPPLRPRADIDG